MGRLDFLCFTSTPDSSTFYGLDEASSFDDLPNSHRDGSSLIIFKSNSNPISPTNLTWSVVSRIPTEDLNLFSHKEHTCIVNADGVFIFFFQNYTADALDVPSGVRYDPFSLPDSDTLIGSKGPGTWKPFKVDPNFQWGSLYDFVRASQALGYVSSPKGPYLVHCILRGTTLQIATHEETSNVLTLSIVGTWYLPNLGDVNPSTIAIGNDHLYVLFRTRMSFGILNSYSLSSISNTLPANKTYQTPPSGTCGDSTSVSPCLFTVLKTLYLICVRPISSPINPELYTIKDPDNDIMLGTPEVLEPGVKVYLDDTSGSGLEYPYKASPSFTAEVVVSISALVVVGFLAAFIYRRKRRLLLALKGLPTEASTASDTPANIDSKPTEPAGSNVQQQQQQQQQQPEMSTPAGGSYFSSATISMPSASNPTTILPMAPITSTSNHQSVQDQKQALQF
ncbi:hypothetical protein K457DRAFT_19486 [Linnemannia elongata AG-77]|uniref:Uncharacterized protein n=1 Tax=Linnemannia elongata AG-77 TaxID=1314771 RepID=A0A197JUV4_9FUNG|nr:hypothetical protein K457DRAFT_19486 [Linnemannia elongata AG-77]